VVRGGSGREECKKDITEKKKDGTCPEKGRVFGGKLAKELRPGLDHLSIPPTQFGRKVRPTLRVCPMELSALKWGGGKETLVMDDKISSGKKWTLKLTGNGIKDKLESKNGRWGRGSQLPTHNTTDICWECKVFGPGGKKKNSKPAPKATTRVASAVCKCWTGFTTHVAQIFGEKLVSQSCVNNKAKKK